MHYRCRVGYEFTVCVNQVCPIGGAFYCGKVSWWIHCAVVENKDPYSLVLECAPSRRVIDVGEIPPTLEQVGWVAYVLHDSMAWPLALCTTLCMTTSTVGGETTVE